ncbi:hypothetical protein PR048_019914 [Dryococelus australis]|uniref:Uncharacterized protein n=1 Tax=Dryococelus australis TaxID=614101 RepID=A0ABQ9H512_9NEOP|nr:hypothetical protein PR048_019914 [Dryococelus australis]
MRQPSPRRASVVFPGRYTLARAARAYNCPRAKLNHLQTSHRDTRAYSFELISAGWKHYIADRNHSKKHLGCHRTNSYQLCNHTSPRSPKALFSRKLSAAESSEDLRRIATLQTHEHRPVLHRGLQLSYEDIATGFKLKIPARLVSPEYSCVLATLDGITSRGEERPRRYPGAKQRDSLTAAVRHPRASQAKETARRRACQLVDGGGLGGGGAEEVGHPRPRLMGASGRCQLQPNCLRLFWSSVSSSFDHASKQTWLRQAIRCSGDSLEAYGTEQVRRLGPGKETMKSRVLYWTLMKVVVERCLRKRSRITLASHVGERTVFDSWRCRSRIFGCGNHAGRCRWSTGFLEDLPLPPPINSGATPYSTDFIIPPAGHTLYVITRRGRLAPKVGRDIHIWVGNIESPGSELAVGDCGLRASETWLVTPRPSRHLSKSH